MNRIEAKQLHVESSTNIDFFDWFRALLISLTCAGFDWIEGEYHRSFVKRFTCEKCWWFVSSSVNWQLTLGERCWAIARLLEKVDLCRCLSAYQSSEEFRLFFATKKFDGFCQENFYEIDFSRQRNFSTFVLMNLTLLFFVLCQGWTSRIVWRSRSMWFVVLFFQSNRRSDVCCVENDQWISSFCLVDKDFNEILNAQRDD